MPRETKPSLEARVAAVEARQDKADELLDALWSWRQTMDESNRLQAEMVEVARDLIGLLRWLRIFGAAVKWLAGVAAAGGVILATFKGYFQ